MQHTLWRFHTTYHRTFTASFPRRVLPKLGAPIAKNRVAKNCTYIQSTSNVPLFHVFFQFGMQLDPQKSFSFFCSIWTSAPHLLTGTGPWDTKVSMLLQLKILLFPRRQNLPYAGMNKTWIANLFCEPRCKKLSIWKGVR